MKIAVTGAAGTIGRRLCAGLAHDHDVVGIDLRDAHVIADVQNLDALVAAFDGCETVVHLAGVVSVTTSWEDTHGPNIAGTYNAFEAARRCGVKRIIFASYNHAVRGDEIEKLPN